MTRLATLLCRVPLCQRRHEPNGPYCEAHARLLVDRAIQGPRWKQRDLARDESGRVAS